MPTVYLTADMAFHHAVDIQKGDTLLVHAATGGVAIAALHILKNLQVEICTTVGIPFKRTLLRSTHGVARAVSSRDLHFVEDVTLTSLNGIKAVMDSLMSPGMVAGSCSLLQRGGHFIEIPKRDIWSAGQMEYERSDVYISTQLLSVSSIPISSSILSNAFREISVGNASSHCQA